MGKQGGRSVDGREFRKAVAGAAAIKAASTVLRARDMAQDKAAAKRNAAPFRRHVWRDHVDTFGQRILLSDSVIRVLEHWMADADTRKIGRKSSNGCIGLYNEQIVEVFDRTPVGTQVKLI